MPRRTAPKAREQAAYSVVDFFTDVSRTFDTEAGEWYPVHPAATGATADEAARKALALSAGGTYLVLDADDNRLYIADDGELFQKVEANAQVH